MEDAGPEPAGLKEGGGELCLSDRGGVSVSLSPRPLPVGGGRSCDRALPGVGGGDPDSGRGSGGDPGLGGPGLTGSASPGHSRSCLRPRMGWEGGRSHLEPARVVPEARLGAGSPRPHSATLPRSCGCQVSTRGPRRGRIGVPRFGAEASEPPRPAPGRRHHAFSKLELLPGCAQVDPGLISCTLASLGVGDNMEWRHPHFMAWEPSGTAGLGFRRS